MANTVARTKASKYSSNTTSTLPSDVIFVEGIEKSVVKSFEDECNVMPSNVLCDINICLGNEHSVVPPKCPIIKSAWFHSNGKRD